MSIYRIVVNDLQLKGSVKLKGSTKIEYSHAGNQLAVSCPKHLYVLATNTLKLRAKFKCHQVATPPLPPPSFLLSLSPSPLCPASTGRIYYCVCVALKHLPLLLTREPTPCPPPPPPPTSKDGATSLCWSGDDSCVSSTGAEGTVFKWDVARGRHAREQHTENLAYSSACIDPKTDLMVATGLHRNYLSEGGAFVLQFEEYANENAAPHPLGGAFDHVGYPEVELAEDEAGQVLIQQTETDQKPALRRCLARTHAYTKRSRSLSRRPRTKPTHCSFAHLLA